MAIDNVAAPLALGGLPAKQDNRRQAKLERVTDESVGAAERRIR
jgi:hypothetical protein